MLIAKLPFGEFLSLLRESGRRLGFSFLIIFIAREADCPSIFKDLEDTWSSLHDLTGEKALFVTIDGTESSPVEKGKDVRQLKDNIGSIRGSYGKVIYSPGCKLLQTIHEQHSYGDVQDWIPEKEFIKESIQRTRSTRQWRDQQTLGISSLISELRDVCEEDIPCLYFESLRSNHAFKVPIESLVSSKLSIYNLVKLSFSQFYKLINEKDLLINKQCSLEKSLRACF